MYCWILIIFIYLSKRFTLQNATITLRIHLREKKDSLAQLKRDQNDNLIVQSRTKENR